LNEIIEGGQLFAQVPGEESRHDEGHRALRTLADRQVVMDDWKQVEAGQLSQEEFRRKYQDVLIDSDAPELGPKVNQVVFAIGRANHGRKEFTDRFFRDALGTINYHNEHTSICELSHHIAWKLATGGKKSHLKPDIMGAEFVIFFGASPLEAEFPMQTMARKVVEAVQGGRFRYAMVDPRFSNSAAKAWRWVPIRPGTDGALALGMIRWMIEHDRIDRRFLENTTSEAAQRDGEPSWSDACYLVRLDTGAYLRTADAGLSGDGYVVIANGQPMPHNQVEHGELDVSQTVNGIACRSAFGLLKDEAFRHSIEEWAALCGIEPSMVEELAREFTSHGKKAAAEFYRGPAQHTNGTASALAIIALNFLIGNIDWKGGLAVGGGHWHELGDKPGQPYPVKRLHPGKVEAWGVPLSREGARYEDSTEFRKNGYPATRPWFPLTKDIWQELFAGMATGYPYPIKAFFLLKGAPTYSTPGMKRVIEETLRDPNKVPLFVAFDIVMGETSSLADYILPDVTIYDGQWATPHVAPTILTKTSHVRQPVIPKVHPETRAVEDVLIDMAVRMGLPGFGPDGFGPGLPLEKQEDWYRKLVANIAYGDHPGDEVPGETEQDKIAYVLARGGRFEPKEKAYDGPYLGHRYAGLCHLYSEAAGTTIDAMTGRRFSGVPHYEPPRDAKGEPLAFPQDYPFQLITYKLPFHTQSRTMANAYLRELMPENAIEINPADAARLGIRQGMLVKVVSPSWPNGIIGPAHLLEGIRPGVVAISHHFGHSQYGAQSFLIDGVPQPADPARANGVHPNPLMQIDPAIGVACLQDLVGGSASFYDTFVRVEPVELSAELPVA
ncbi:MAG: molybdopterin oxidoreductase, partial [Nitrospirae bacterium]